MVMPSDDTYINNIPFYLLDQLSAILNEDNSWKIVAEAFTSEFNVISKTDFMKIQRDEDHAGRLIHHLGIRMCNVECFRKILERKQLYNALAVISEPKIAEIIVQPGENGVTQYVLVGTELRLECQASGLPPPMFIWFHDGVKMEDQTSGILHIPAFSEEDKGEYQCHVYQDVNDDWIKLHSNIVKVELRPTPPVIIQQPDPIYECLAGQDIMLRCFASGHPEPKYEWFRFNTQISEARSDILYISGIQKDHEGIYRCYVRNGVGDGVWSVPSRLSVVPQRIRSGPGKRVTAQGKFALLFAADTYTNFEDLKTPKNDVIIVADILKQFGFEVMVLHNQTLREMKIVLEMFYSLLSEGSYALVFFGGHGFEMRVGYMLPVDAPKNYLCRDALCFIEVVREVSKRKAYAVMLLDMCLLVPDRKENPAIYEEKQEVFKCKGPKKIVVTSTTSNSRAFETGDCSNFVKCLKEYLPENKPIEEILFAVKRALGQNAEEQKPCILTDVPVDLYLSDPSDDNEKATRKLRKLITLPQIVPVLRFNNVKCAANLKIRRYKDHFLNSLEVVISGVQRWTLKVSMEPKTLGFEPCRLENMDIIATIHHLQRLKKDEEVKLYLILKDPVTEKEVDSAVLNLGKPLIANSSLWHKTMRKKATSGS